MDSAYLLGRYVTDCRVRRSTRDRLLFGILDAFEQTAGKVRIASPQMQVTEFPPFAA